MTAPLIRLDGVTHAFGGPAVLEAVTLSVSSGEFVGIVGPSGSGKSTLLRILAGALRPVAGTVHRSAAGISYVPQVETVDWNFPVTVNEVVTMARTGGRWLPWSSKAEQGEVTVILDRLGLGGLGRRHIRELSGGQQQRVFIARALLRQANLLLLDEPTSGVDVRTRHDVLHLLGDLHAEGLAIVLTTHDLNGIAAHLPRLVCLNRQVVADGAPREVITPEVLERTYGARMEVIEHAGMPIVFEGGHALGVRAPAHDADVISLRRGAR
ncbi:MAG TPA: metal ABC transporter ATP-binding protein [Mycobacteriales bacterium]|nr:metal ABC transporter ATP-binding protein [Mycobacteriales bacterium]